MTIQTDIIARMPDGKAVHRFRLTNAKGAVVELTDWGARWISAQVPDNKGRLGDVIVCPDDILNDRFYMGATIGRFANRIAGAQITIDGNVYMLDKNDGQNTNHGGCCGFDSRLWQHEVLECGVRFTLVSPDCDGGYPGTVNVSVDYLWDDDCRLTVNYRGVTDRPTYLNMTNHAYFDLGCHGGKVQGAVHGYELKIPSHHILDTTSDFIPTGKAVGVGGTPFDFTTAKPIGRDIHADNAQLRCNRGYNHCYVLKTLDDDTMVEAALLRDPASGRWLRVSTDLPSVLLYTAGYYPVPDSAVCLEAQYYPDTPSHPDFPSCLLRPGDTYSHTTVFHFGHD